MIFDRNFHYTIQLQLVIISSSRKEPCAFRLDLNIDVQGNNTFSTSFLEELEMIIRQHVHQHPEIITSKLSHMESVSLPKLSALR